MASTSNLRNGNAPSRPTLTSTNTPQPSLAERGALFLANAAQNGLQPQPARRLVIPTRYMELEPPQPLSAINDDPVFDTHAAAVLLGVTYECLRKWRQRNQGPDYIQYGDKGPIRYAVSALIACRTAHTVCTAGKK
jgi:hypothetical protein